MKPGHYFVVLLLAIAGGVLVVALILITHANQQLQAQFQAQQQALNQGILGQQAQQISGDVLQDLAKLAVGNPALRQLFKKYGYHVLPSGLPAATEAQLLPSGSASRALAARDAGGALPSLHPEAPTP